MYRRILIAPYLCFAVLQSYRFAVDMDAERLAKALLCWPAVAILAHFTRRQS